MVTKWKQDLKLRIQIRWKKSNVWFISLSLCFFLTIFHLYKKPSILRKTFSNFRENESKSPMYSLTPGDCNFIQKSMAQVFYCKFREILKTIIYETHLGDCFWSYLHGKRHGLLSDKWSVFRCGFNKNMAAEFLKIDISILVILILF